MYLDDYLIGKTAGQILQPTTPKQDYLKCYTGRYRNFSEPVKCLLRPNFAFFRTDFKIFSAINIVAHALLAKAAIGTS